MMNAPSEVRVSTRHQPNWLSGLLIFGGGIVLLSFLFVIHITQGLADLPYRTVVEAIIAPQDVLEHHIVQTVRLPRVVVGILAGGALAVAGVLLQTVTRNPLASAGTLGINAGAYLITVIAAIFIPSVLSAAPILVSFTGGVFAALLAYALGGGIQATPLRMTLAGMVVSMAFAALTAAMQLFFEEETQGLFLWGSGSLIQNDWDGVRHAWPWILASAFVAFLFSHSFDLLELDEDTARSLGQHVDRTRLFAVVLALLLAAVTVSIVGPIGFVGLLAPHLMRLIGFRRHRLLIPASFLWGAIVLVTADIGAQMANSSSWTGELPVGAVTALIGGPWLAWLSYRAARNYRGVPKAAEVSQRVKRLVSYPKLMVLISISLLVACMAGVMMGGLRLGLLDVLAVFSGTGSDLAHSIVLEHRLPRVLVALFAGAALAVSGLLLQGVVRNPMADPSIVGVSAGAGVGALLVLLVWPQVPIGFLPIASFGGAVLAAVIVYLIARKTGLQPAVLALVGIAISACGSAIIQVIVIEAKLNAAVAIAWLSGSTYARGWSELMQVLPWPILLLPIAWYIGRSVDTLGFGREMAMNWGVRVERVRLQAGIIGVALAASAVATVGTIGFIGLIAPHAARLLIGHRHRKLLWFSALLGALLLVLADLVGRTIMPPKEIPSGLIVSLLGAPYFLWLMRCRSLK